MVLRQLSLFQCCFSSSLDLTVIYLNVLFKDDDDANETGGKKVPLGGVKRPLVSYNILKIILKYSVFPIFIIVLPFLARMC